MVKGPEVLGIEELKLSAYDQRDTATSNDLRIGEVQTNIRLHELLTKFLNCAKSSVLLPTDPLSEREIGGGRKGGRGRTERETERDRERQRQRDRARNKEINAFRWCSVLRC